MEFLKTLEETFAPAKFIDQAEKNTQAILAYVEPKELSKTLVNFTAEASDFARAQVVTFNSITTIAKTQVEEFTKSFAKVASK